VFPYFFRPFSIQCGKQTKEVIPVGLKRQRRVLELQVNDIRPNPMQPRQVFSEEPLKELAASIATHGILQPLTVRRVGSAWELVAGERRLRAAKLAGLKTVPCLETTVDDRRSAELALVEAKCRELGVNVALSEVWAKGGEGGKALAEEVVRLCEEPNEFEFCYEADTTIMEKLNAIATRIYRADGVQLVGNAVKQIKQLEELGFSNLPICMAKTQYSFSDDQKKLGAPRNFTIQVRNLKVSAGAGFIVALTGDIMTMPGLPKVPAAEKIDVDENGVIHGLF
jgi:hypothetical protein